MEKTLIWSFVAQFFAVVVCLQITGCQKSENVPALKKELASAKIQKGNFQNEISELASNIKSANQSWKREVERQNCIGRLKVIDAAKQVWAIRFRKKAEDIPTELELSTSTKPFPLCPANGSLKIGAVSELPRCSIGGHEIVFGYVDGFRGVSNILPTIAVGPKPQDITDADASEYGSASVKDNTYDTKDSVFAYGASKGIALINAQAQLPAGAQVTGTDFAKGGQYSNPRGWKCKIYYTKPWHK
ncbi:MAG: hypothetical protein M3Y82_15165 [Verrucomicrobiota bacterium]|nr:hypothetical protein [Verrucomicrobiota bacterium]